MLKNEEEEDYDMNEEDHLHIRIEISIGPPPKYLTTCLPIVLLRSKLESESQSISIFPLTNPPEVEMAARRSSLRC